MSRTLIRKQPMRSPAAALLAMSAGVACLGSCGTSAFAGLGDLGNAQSPQSSAADVSADGSQVVGRARRRAVLFPKRSFGLNRAA